MAYPYYDMYGICLYPYYDMYGMYLIPYQFAGAYPEPVFKIATLKKVTIKNPNNLEEIQLPVKTKGVSRKAASVVSIPDVAAQPPTAVAGISLFGKL